MIMLSIDVSKIDKSRIKEVKRRDGSIGKFLDLVLFENKDGEDKFGNHGMVKQSSTKEERDAGTQLPILGNFKHSGQKPQGQQEKPACQPRRQQVSSPDGDDIPF